MLRRWMNTLAVLTALLIGCRREEISLFSEWENGLAEALINGKTLNDPECVLRPRNAPFLTLRSSATQYVDPDSATYGARFSIFRVVYINIYAGNGARIGDIYMEFANFNPGPKPLVKLNNSNRYRNYTSSLGIRDGDDIFLGGATFDDTQPYSLIIDKYDPVAGIVEGRFDITYTNVSFKLQTGLDTTTTSIRLSEGKFRAKIRKHNKYGWLDEQ